MPPLLKAVRRITLLGLPFAASLLVSLTLSPRVSAQNTGPAPG